MSFEKWLNEIELFSLRRERIGVIENMSSATFWKWLEAAYQQGKIEGLKDAAEIAHSYVNPEWPNDDLSLQCDVINRAIRDKIDE